MPDREKVIKGLETCRTRVNCKECPYAYDKRANDSYCEAVLHNDAIDLLKEQEAVKPKKVKGFNPPIYLHLSFICDNCKTDLITNQPYCSGCGKPVKWE